MSNHHNLKDGIGFQKNVLKNIFSVGSRHNQDYNKRRSSWNPVLLLGVYVSVLVVSHILINRGFFLYSFDDLIRLLQGKNILEGSGQIINKVWLPLPSLLLGLAYAITGMHALPGLLNLGFTVTALYFVYAITRRLLPGVPAASWAAVLLCMFNSRVALLGVSGASEPLLWAFLFSHLYYYLLFLRRMETKHALVSGLLLGLACWVRPEAWILLLSEAAVLAYDAARKRSAIRALNYAGYLAVPSFLLVVFFYLYHVRYGAPYWRVQAGELQKYGIGAVKLYPLALWRMTGGLLGAAGFAAGALRLMKKDSGRLYLLTASTAFTIFALSSVTGGAAVLYRRTVVWALMIFAPVIGAGWSLIAVKFNIFKLLERHRLTATVFALIILTLYIPHSFLSREGRLSFADDRLLAAKEITSIIPSSQRTNILLELHRGTDQELIHGAGLFVLLSGRRQVFFDRRPDYERINPGDIHRIITDDNPSLFELEAAELTEYLLSEKIGLIVAGDADSAVLISRKTGWQVKPAHPFYVLKADTVGSGGR